MKVYELYKKLLKDNGHPKEIWPQWCGVKMGEAERELVAVGAVLTQRTSWRNAEMALKNLRMAGLLSLPKIADVELDRLTELVRVAGFFNTKPRRLQELARFVLEKYGSLEEMRKISMKPKRPVPRWQSQRGRQGGAIGPALWLRDELLGIYGIGPETADTLLLYALDLPSFVIDEYTKRFVKKYGLFGSERSPVVHQGEVEEGQGTKLGLKARSSGGTSPSIRQSADSGKKPRRLNDYEELKNLFESSLSKNVEIYQNYHVLIIVDQKGRDGSLMEEV